MAQQKGVLKIEGSLDDLTFYQSQDGNLVRKRGSLNKSRISSDPSFLRTRENNAEFGSAAGASKLLRDTTRSLSADTSDGRMISRLLKQMMLIRLFDTSSLRGQRQVAIGIEDPEAQQLLKGFNFNRSAVLGSVLFSEFAVNEATGAITIPGFVPLTSVLFPEGATHVTLTGGFAKVNSADGTEEMELTNVVNLPIDSTITDVTLTPGAVPAGTGTSFYLLKISFSQIVNKTEYTLNNGRYNSLEIVEVA